MIEREPTLKCAITCTGMYGVYGRGDQHDLTTSFVHEFVTLVKF